jgi:hypothetical protein
MSLNIQDAFQNMSSKNISYVSLGDFSNLVGFDEG